MEQLDISNIQDNELSVQVSVVGEVYGSDSEGNPVKQNITEESLKKIADNINDSNQQILVDRDHGSARIGLNKDTRAVGWLSKFWANAKGLFAKMFLTPFGKKLVEGKEYRYLSPSFIIAEDGTPMSLESAGAVNTPAMSKIKPLINSKPISEDKGIEDMTKEELKDLIKETISEMKDAEEKAEVVEEVKEEKVEETVDNGCSEAEEKVENACSEVKNEEVVEEVKEEKIEEVKEEPVEEKKEEEVIKMEALNSKPVALAGVDDKSWMNLHGKEFFTYLNKHPEIVD